MQSVCLWFPQFELCVLPNGGQEILVWVVLYTNHILVMYLGGSAGMSFKRFFIRPLFKPTFYLSLSSIKNELIPGHIFFIWHQV